MSVIRKLISFLRWRLVPVRYLERIVNLKWSKVLRRPPSRTEAIDIVKRQGHGPGPSLTPEVLQGMLDVYQARTLGVQPKKCGHPFVNLFQADDFNSDNPVFKFAFSPPVLDAAADYFGGRVVLDSIQVLYSWPGGDELRESQFWHLDYGDSRSFHCVAYLKDVLTPEDGPFVFVNKHDTARIGRSAIIRRISDQQFERELGDGVIQRFYGHAGASVLIDPAVCYHYGSRCQNPRLAIFVTFSSWFPFARPVPLVVEHAERILAAACRVRPDLSKSFLTALLQLD